jgi:DNA repair and recombination protein RAD52
VDGLHVIEEANRIFGHGGWSYIIKDMRQVSRVETTDAKGNPQIRVGYYCAVRASIGEQVMREGAAVGSGMAKPENEADAHESAVKEAETDALKRALRCFGYTFGLALYEKDKARRKVTDPHAVIALKATMTRAVEGAKDTAQLNAITGDPRFKADMEKLHGMDVEAAADVAAVINRKTSALAGVMEPN